MGSLEGTDARTGRGRVIGEQVGKGGEGPGCFRDLDVNSSGLQYLFKLVKASPCVMFFLFISGIFRFASYC